jgi:hypothetical protein
MKTLLAVIVMAGTLHADPWLDQRLEDSHRQSEAEAAQRAAQQAQDIKDSFNSMQSHADAEAQTTALQNIANAIQANGNNSPLVIPAH